MYIIFYEMKMKITVWNTEYNNVLISTRVEIVEI